jgi:hypothetical protein
MRQIAAACSRSLTWVHEVIHEYYDRVPTEDIQRARKWESDMLELGISAMAAKLSRTKDPKAATALAGLVSKHGLLHGTLAKQSLEVTLLSPQQAAELTHEQLIALARGEAVPPGAGASHPGAPAPRASGGEAPRLPAEGEPPADEADPPGSSR